jgi:AraC-like DNA-binding protein
MDQTSSTLFLDSDQVEARLIWANKKVVEPRHLQLTSKGEAFTVCWLVVRGHVRVLQKDHDVRAGKGVWMFPAAGPFTQDFSSGARILSIRFDLALRGGTSLFLRPQPRTLPSARAPELEKSARRLIDLLDPWAGLQTFQTARPDIPFAAHLRIDAAFRDWLSDYVGVMQMLKEVTARTPGHSPILQRALTLLEEHPMKEPFSVTSLANLCGVSVNHLIRIFHTSMGSTPRRVYERRRLRLAHQFLSESSVPLKEIAFDLGFSSPPHFSTWFKRREGCSPRAWRRLHETG